MLIPITAKSPVSSSQMSGQFMSAAVCAPLACGSGPSLRTNFGSVLMLPNNQGGEGKTQEQNTSYSWFRTGGRVGYATWLWQHIPHIANYSAKPFAVTAKRRK